MNLKNATLSLALLLVGPAQMHAVTPQFAARVSIATGLNQLSDVVAADFNGDGKVDLAVDDYLGRKIAVYLNNGAGGFGTPIVTPLTLGGTTGALVAGDVNEDGKQDLVVGTISGGDQQNLLLLGNGDGSFTQKSMLPGSYGFQQARLTDLNNDGHLDFVGADLGNIQIYLGDGKGTFNPVSFSNLGTGAFFFSVAVADFNRDSKPDLIAGGYQTQDLRYYAGNGDGTFQAPITFNPIAHSQAYYISAGDMNGDGRPDVVYSVPSIPLIVFGNGDGTFRGMSRQQVSPPIPVSSPSTSSQAAPAVAIADVDKDGTLDVVVVDRSTNTLNIDLNSNGQGDFIPNAPDISVPVPANCNRLQIADLNGDGSPDIVTTSSSTNEISVFLSVLPKVTPTLTLTGGGTAALAGTPIVITAKVAGSPVPTGSVTLYDALTALGTQTLDAAGQAVFPPATLSTGSHSISATYSGDTRYNSLAITSAAGVFIQHIVDVSVSLPMPSQTISSGGTASYPVVLSPTIDFTGSVVLSCSGLPAGFTCPPVTAIGTSATLMVTPPATIAGAVQSRDTNHLHLVWIAFGFCILPVARNRTKLSLLCAAMVFCVLVPSGCSTNSSSAPAKRYTGSSTFAIIATITQGNSTATRTSAATLVVQ